MNTDLVKITSDRIVNFCFVVILLIVVLITEGCKNIQSVDKPNFVIIFCDDMGYGDLGCFGSEVNRTPEIDRMAEEGICFTSFYVTSGVCTPSRSSLMTGCYPLRVGMDENTSGFWVLFPGDRKGLNPSEITIPEILKKQDYTTACIGKWHLGDQPVFLPTRQGFDYYFGIPYSNDMGNDRDKNNPPLPLMRHETIIEAPVDQSTITQRYTAEAISFIKQNKEKPFFLYLPHTMPHYPLHASEAFSGKSNNGKYGDAIEEIDWSTGQILNTLRDLDLDKNTMVVFTSDNGATRSGSNAPFSGGKCGIMEGSMREPCVMWWPGNIPSGQKCSELTTTMDLLPTLAHLSGGEVPGDRVIDGKDITPLILGETEAKTPHEVFYYYFMSQLQAVRSGKWKLFLPFKERQYGWLRKLQKAEAELFDLETDPAESINVIDKYPDVARKLMEYAEEARADIGDYQREGANARTAGWVEKPEFLLVREN